MSFTKLFSGLGAVLLATNGLAFNPQPEPPPSSLPFSMGDDDQITISVVNAVDQMRAYFPAGELGEYTCTMRLLVVDAQGEVVFSSEVRIDAGQMRSVRVRARRLGILEGERRSLRASVHFNGDAGTRLRCNGTARASVEIFHGRTRTQGAILEIPTSWVSGIEPTPF